MHEKIDTDVVKSWFRKRGPAILIIVSTAVLATASVYFFTQPPQVKGYVLKESLRKISVNAPLKIVFTQPMDRRSVEKAFKVEPKVEGTIRWDFNSLIFEPREAFKVGQKFRITLDRTAKSLFMRPLSNNYEENFEIIEPPQVLFFSQATDSVNVSSDAKVTIHFDRPMAVLTELNNYNSQRSILKFEPAVEGRIKWLGTSTFGFIPQKLLNATHYTVTIPAGTASADGGKTDKDFVYSFETVKPDLLNSSPETASVYNRPGTKIKLNFNQRINIHGLENYVSLWMYKGGDSKLQITSLYKEIKNEAFRVLEKFNLADRQESNGPGGPDDKYWQRINFKAAYYSLDEYELDQKKNTEDSKDTTAPDTEELQKTIVLKPLNPLPDNSFFVLRIDKNFAAAEGNLPLGLKKTVIFKTVGAVSAISATSPADENNLRSKDRPKIIFNQPMDTESLKENVVIEPPTIDAVSKKEKKPDFYGLSQREPGGISIYYDFQPATAYTITVKKGASSLAGKILAQDFILKFKTGNLAPNFKLVQSDGVSIVDGNKSPVYYVKTTNINTLHFEFAQLSEDDFNLIYSKGRINFTARPKGQYQVWDKKLQTALNKTETHRIDFAKELNRQLESGYYYFELSSPEAFYQDDFDQSGEPAKRSVKLPPVTKQVFIVTKTALAIKVNNKQLLTWATSLKEGIPVKDMDLTATGWLQGKKVVLKAKTDNDGLAVFDLSGLKKDTAYDTFEFTVTGRAADDITLTNTTWAEGIAPWNFNVDYSGDEQKYFGYIYTDRPIYRPGHIVYFKGLARAQEDMKFTLPSAQKIHTIIKDGQDNIIYEKDIDFNKNGTFNDELKLSENGDTGNYSITASLKEAAENGNEAKFYQTFAVKAYRKPDYKLTLENDKKSYINGDRAKITVNGQYFFGAPLAQSKIVWKVRSLDYYFSIPPESQSPYALKWFNFSADGAGCYFSCQGESSLVTEGKAILDANGKYVIDLPLDITQKNLSQIYTVEVTVFDLNNQSVSDRISLLVHRGEFYLGVMSVNYVAQKGKETKFEIVSLDSEGKAARNKTAQVALYRREWNTIKKKNVDSGFYYENNYEDTLVEKKAIVTDNDGHALTGFTAKEGGHYKVVAETADGRGNKIAAETGFYAASEKLINWGLKNNDRIELVADKLEYKPGETAHVMVKSPYRDVYALVTQEREGILQKKVIKITSNSQIIDVPITEKSLPNVFVSVLLIKGSASTAGLPDPGKEVDERDVAAFKLGYVTLQVNSSSKKILMEITPDRQKYHPGEEVTLKIKVADIKGRPVKAELSLSVVDESVLSLTENVTADLLMEFYRKRFLGVMSAHALTKALSRINVQVESGMKGGGGGKPGKRGNFKDTAYWQAVLNTNANGTATAKFRLPDNLTTWQVLAIGITEETLVGSQKNSFIVTKDVVVRPVLPRFLIVDDKLTAGAIVHNYTDRTLDFDIKLKTAGVIVGSDTARRIRIDPGKQQLVNFPLTVTNALEADFVFEALAINDNHIGDTVEIKLPIHPFSFPEVVATSSVISDNEKHIERVLLPFGINQKFGELTVSVAATLADSISQGIQYLVKFPYGCAEQVASSLLGNLAVKQLANLLPFERTSTIDLKDLQKKVEAGLQTLYKYQNSNNGWGLWENFEATPYLSAYVLFALHQAQKAGYAVDNNVFKKGIEYLKNHMVKQLSTSDTTNAGPGYWWPMEHEANNRAYALYLLAEVGQGDLALSNNLFEFKEKLNIFGKAYLAMNYHILANSPGLAESVISSIKNKINGLKQEIMLAARETPRGVQFEETSLDYRLFDTNNRTTALVLQMLVKIDPDHLLIPKILKHLLVKKKDGHYASTQETAAVLMALIDYLSASKEFKPNYAGAVSLNGTEKMRQSFTTKNFDAKTINIPLSELLPDNQDNEIAVSHSGTGKMYFDMNLKYYLPTEQIEAKNEGILVLQEYFKLDDKKQENAVTQAVLGENLLGKMTIVVPEDRYYVMVEDYLPAGLEGIDFSLRTSEQNLQQGLEEEEAKKQGKQPECAWCDESAHFNHSEVRDDRVMYFADFLPKGVYEIKYFVRAATQGTFHDLPAMASELYFPEVFGRSGGGRFVVN